MLSPHITPETEQFCGGVETYYERSLRSKYRSQGYRLRFMSPPLLRQTPWEIRSPQGPQEILGIREQISRAPKERDYRGASTNSPGFYLNIFLVRKASGGWHPVIDLKNLKAHIHAPHFCMFTTSSVLSSVQKGDYAFKIDLQDVYFHVPIHPSSRRYLRFTFENSFRCYHSV